MLRQGISVGVITFVSRITGFFRAFLIAYYFGSSGTTDAYFSAFKISNFFRQLLGEGALGNSFIPLYNKIEETEGENRGKEFIFSVLNLLFIFSSVVTILMIIFSDQIINLIVSGFPEDTKELASHLLKIMSFYFVFISLSGMLGAMLNNFRHFLVPAATSIFFNLAIIASAILCGQKYGIDALAWGVVVGGVLQFLVVLPTFFKIVKTYSLKINWKDPYIKKLILMTLPMLGGIMARQLNTVVDQWFASNLETGAVTALENATRLYLLPVGVFGVSLSTVIYPSLAQAVAKHKNDIAEKYILKGLNILLFLVIPSILVLTIYSEDVVRLTLSYGKFGEEAVKVTANALLYYSIGLYFYTGIFLMTRAFYSMQNSAYPVVASIVSIIINIVLNFVFIKPFGYKGLALSTSIAAGVNFLMLLFEYRRKYICFNLKKTLIFLLKSIVFSAIAFLASYKINLSLVKITVFGLVYLLFWARGLYKNKMEVF
ncbi:murein biosynthesis integral membrane protein MurJ [Fusobacterium hominis]|uniref:Probable lipid II flippase MurJ n=1 Tax=Fusobacterium hominis TaxID=2764326 RepID=A0A7G9GYA3_9FUSO|nr:murein biosynthesis integral membrane protein MurJ [Fusobacterium hominis]QNM15785.1 murein biosynthesis integral membrane protein MurJ [Fusobacterium hominis]